MGVRVKKITVVAVLLAVLTLAGCARVVGQYYLQEEKYEQGIEILGQQLRENPEDATAAYYLGRYYLGLNKPELGLEYLDKAVALDPEDADYVFWKGVAHWALMDFEKERAAYEKAVSLKPKHISANLYLGHGYVDEGKWAKAVEKYDTVLEVDPYNPEALFNRAVALNGLGKQTEEMAAWKKFLEYYPEGNMALQATERLNLHGNFAYRNFILGNRNVTLLGVTFKPGTDVLESDSKQSLHLLSAMLKENTALAFHIVAYNKGDKALAKAQAKAVKAYMLGGNPTIDPNRLPLSWFGTAEVVEVGEKQFALDQSVQFITVVP